MPAPTVKIKPAFIGHLVKLRNAHKGDPRIFERLCIRIRQCREINRGDHEQQIALAPLIDRTRKELAELGILA